MPIVHVAGNPTRGVDVFLVICVPRVSQCPDLLVTSPCVQAHGL